MGNIAYVAGFLTGLAIVFIAAIICRKINHNEIKYDERQMIARGRAYEYGFFTLLLYMCVISAFYDVKLIKTYFMIFMWGGICLAIFIVITICIIKNAYMSLSENPKKVFLIFLFIIGINGFVSIEKWLEEGLIVKNQVQPQVLNLLVSVIFILISIVFAGKVLYDKKHDEEE